MRAEAKDLVKRAKAAGLDTTVSGSGHLIFRDVRGVYVASASSTPSDFRAYNNTERQLARAGYDLTSRKGARMRRIDVVLDCGCTNHLEQAKWNQFKNGKRVNLGCPLHRKKSKVVGAVEDVEASKQAKDSRLEHYLGRRLPQDRRCTHARRFTDDSGEKFDLVNLADAETVTVEEAARAFRWELISDLDYCVLQSGHDASEHLGTSGRTWMEINGSGLEIAGLNAAHDPAARQRAGLTLPPVAVNAETAASVLASLNPVPEPKKDKMPESEAFKAARAARTAAQKSATRERTLEGLRMAGRPTSVTELVDSISRRESIASGTVRSRLEELIAEGLVTFTEVRGTRRYALEGHDMSHATQSVGDALREAMATQPGAEEPAPVPAPIPTPAVLAQRTSRRDLDDFNEEERRAVVNGASLDDVRERARRRKAAENGAQAAPVAEPVPPTIEFKEVAPMAEEEDVRVPAAVLETTPEKAAQVLSDNFLESISALVEAEVQKRLADSDRDTTAQLAQANLAAADLRAKVEALTADAESAQAMAEEAEARAVAAEEKIRTVQADLDQANLLRTTLQGLLTGGLAVPATV